MTEPLSALISHLAHPYDTGRRAAPDVLLQLHAIATRSGHAFDPLPESQGYAAIPDRIVQTVQGIVSLPGDLADVLVAGVSSVLIPPGLGFPAARLGGVLHIGLPHVHFPFPAQPAPLCGVGPVCLVGAINVVIGFQPALRVGDIGFAPTCMGSPAFKIFTGSASVFVGGKRAARTLDLTDQCPFALSGAAGAVAAVATAHERAMEVFGTVMAALDTVSIATGVIAHGAAAISEYGDEEVPHEVAVARGRAEVGQAVANLLQTSADAGLNAVHELIGLVPSIMSLGAGVLVPMMPTPQVMIGGLPAPDIASHVNAFVTQWAMRVATHPGRVRACRAAGSSWWHALFGHPVDAVDGHVFADHTDVVADALTFSRLYDSRAGSGDCGVGMRHTFERGLEVWLHRVVYVDREGVRVPFPAFRGRERVSLDGYVAEKKGHGRYEITHRGETMCFVATPGVRAARLVEIRRGETCIAIDRDDEGRFRSARVGTRALHARRDADGRITAIHDERGIERAAFAYDDGCLVASRDAEGAEERFAYDADNRLIEWTDARGYRFVWRYDAEGRCTHTSGETGQWACDFAYAKNQTTVTHANGLIETISYDAYGVVLKIKRSDGTVLLSEQDETGRIVRERDGAGRTVEMVYDDDGALVARRDRFGNDLPPDEDPRAPSPLARVLPETHAARLGFAAGVEPDTTHVPESLASLAAWALPTPSSSRERSTENDALGRPIRVVDARGASTALRRDAAGNVVEITDRDRRVTRAHVTGWNLVGSVVDPIGRRVDATYTSTEEVLSYRDAAGVLTEYGRDAADRLTSITRGGALVERYVHDASGRLIEKKDADDRTLLRVTHHRNALPARMDLTEGGSIELDYDARGRVTRAKLGEHDARLERDIDRMVLFDRIEGRGIRRWRLGLRETTSLLERFETRIDRTGDLTVVRDPSGGLSTFDARASRVVRRLANGTTEILAIDPEGRLEGRLAHRRTSDGALACWAVRYERSAEGDLLSVWDTARGERRFEIDEAHRLEGEIDERGTYHSYAHAPNDELARPSSLVHDARGRVAERDGDRFTYDSLDQLVRVDLANGSIWRGSYDGLGRLRRFGIEGAQTFLYWDGDRIAAELAPSGALRVHVFADASALIPFAFVDYASVDAEPASGRAYYVFHDASGMPTQIEDATGRTVWWADRVDPYGALTIHEGAELDYALRWPGHLFDPALGLHHNRFRAYDPALARYLQPDPIGHAGSPQSLYAYAPNPLVDVDVLGLECTARPAHTSEEPTEGHPLHEDPRGTLRNSLGRLIDAVTSRFVRDPNAPESSRARPNVHMTREEITGGRRARLDASSEPVRTYLAERRTALDRAEVARARGDTAAANAEQARANRATEHIGEAAAHAEVMAQHPDAELLYAGSGPGQFDGVYRIPGDPPRILVVEAKGGSARESSSRAFGGDQVQQGTPEYRGAVAQSQNQRGMATENEPMRDAGRAVLSAGDDVEYICVCQPIRDGNELGDIRAYRYGASTRDDAPTSSPGAPRGPPQPSSP